MKITTVISIAIVAACVCQTHTMTSAGGIGPVEHVCIIDIDGCRRDALYGLLTSSPESIPNMASIVLGEEFLSDPRRGRGTFLGRTTGSGQYQAVRWATTAFPSYTFVCQASLFTGCYPASTGIPGNEFFDRTAEERFAFSGGSVRDFDHIAGVYEYDFIFLDRDLDSVCDYVLEDVTDLEDWRYGGFANNTLAVPTIYEEASAYGLSSLVAFNMYHSSGHRENPLITWIQPTRNDLCTYLLEDAWDYDNSMMTQLVERLKGYAEVPEIITAYFAGHDHYCHEHDEAQIYYLQTYVDVEVGRLIETLKALGVHDTTLFVITTDHGMMDVIADDEHSIVMEDELEEVIEDYLSWWGWPNFDVFDWSDWFFGDDFSAYVALNGGLAHIYLRNLDTDDWDDYPRWEDMEAVADLLLDYDYLNARAEGVYDDPPRTSMKIEMVLVRNSEEAWSWDTPYRVFQGAGLPTRNLGEYIEEHWPEFPYVDAVWMFENLNSPLTGDIIVLPNRDLGYTISEEVENDHGSIYPEDMYIPMIFAGAPYAGMTEIVPEGSIVDVAPTVADLLGFDMPNAQGRSLSVATSR